MTLIHHRIFVLTLILPFTAEAASGQGTTPRNPSADQVSSEDEFVPAQLQRDGSGTVWAVGGHPADPYAPRSTRTPAQQLASFDEPTSAWLPVSLPTPDEQASPTQIVISSEGKLIVLWKGVDQTFLTRHLGGAHQKWLNLAGDWTAPRITALADGGVCVTESGRKVLLAMSSSAPPQQLEMDERYFLIPPTRPPTIYFMPVSAVQSSNGTVYLWGSALDERSIYWRLCGLVKVEGESILPVEQLPFDSKTPISAVASAGNLLFIAENGKGVWETSDDFATVRLVSDPENALQFVEQISVLQGDVYFIACPRPNTSGWQPSRLIPEYSSPFTRRHYKGFHRTGSLYQYDQSGVRVVAQGLDKQPHFRTKGRNIVRSKGGLFVGSHAGHALWLSSNKTISPEGKAELLDSSWGIDFTPANIAVCLPDERRLLVSNGSQWGLFDSTSPKRPPPHPRTSTITTRGPLLVDADRSVWAVRDDPPDLVQWDGQRWVEMPKPPLHPEDCHHPSFDGKNQLWMVDKYNRASAVMNAESGEWSLFDTAELAAAARLAPGDFVGPVGGTWTGIISHANGSIGFGTPSETIHVLMHGKWHRFKSRNLPFGIPFSIWRADFNADGLFTLIEETGMTSRFASNNQTRVLALLPDGTWDTSIQPLTSIKYSHSYQREAASTPAASRPSQASVLHPDGRFWTISRTGEVFITREGVHVQWGQDHPSPFPSITSSRDLIIDRFGDVHYPKSTEQGHDQWITLRPLKEDQPVTIRRSDAAYPSLSISGPAKLWQRWKRGDGEWSKLSQSTTIPLKDLPPGDYRFQIEVYDRELGRLKAFPDYIVTLRGADATEIKSLIRGLADADLDARERAARALRKQGRTALTELRQALSTTTDDSHRWWIESVIQAIEDARK